MKSRTLWILLFCVIALSCGALAQDAYRDGQNAIRNVFPEGGQELVDATSIEALPSYTATPPETAYYSDQSGMVDAGAAALTGEDGAATAYGRAVSPNYMDEGEARGLLSSGLAVEADPLAVVGASIGLEGQYGACTDSAVYGETSTRYGCEVSGSSRIEPQTCEYSGRPRVETVWIYTTRDRDQRDWLVGSNSCTQISETQVPGRIPVYQWELECDHQVPTNISVQIVTRQLGFELEPQTCAAFAARPECSGQSEICVAGPEVNGYGVADGVPDYAAYIDYYPDLTAAFETGSWTPCHGHTKSECGLIHWTAFGLSEGRYMPMGGECWRMRMEASCEVMTGDVFNSCTPPDPGCELVQATCLSTGPGGTCISEHHEYACPATPIQTGTVSLCSENVYCITGDCFPAIEAEPSDQFAEATAAFAAVFEGAKQLDETSLTIFDGENLQCGKAIFGAFNCCKDEGLLNDLGLNQCNADEQRLAQSQDLHECTYVGSYCDEKTFFGVCLKKKRSYCCHGSRLSRILTEQGRAQLGRDYGGAKSPDCSGFTVDEFASLDIGAMDLSEFYEDLEASLTLPDPLEASQAMQERLADYGN
jgi:hypothetical protein